MFSLEPVKLGYSSYESYVDQETMRQLEALLANNTYCRTCQQKFTHERPEVSKNACLPCFERSHENLEYTGIVWTKPDGTPEYLFEGYRGRITTTMPNSSHATEDVWATLKYHRFNIPEMARIDGADVELVPSRWWSLYTDPRRYAVIATQQPQYGGKIYVFLLTKDGGPWLYLDKRNKRVREMLLKARTALLAGIRIRGIGEDEWLIAREPTSYQEYQALVEQVITEHESEATQ